MTEGGDSDDPAARKLHRLLKLSDCVFVHTLLLVGHSRIQVGLVKRRVEFHGLESLLDGGIVVVSVVVVPLKVNAHLRIDGTKIIGALAFCKRLLNSARSQQIVGVPMMGRSIAWV